MIARASPILLEEIRLDGASIGLHGECHSGERGPLLSVAGHPERQSGNCVSALPPGAIAQRDWAEGTLGLSRGERDR